MGHLPRSSLSSLSGLTLSGGKLIQQLADLGGQGLVGDVGMTFPYSASDEPEPFDVEDHRSAMRIDPARNRRACAIERKEGSGLYTLTRTLPCRLLGCPIRR